MSADPAPERHDRSDNRQPEGYLDAASTEPLHPAARAALLAALDEGWADPARLYSAARRAALLLDGARAAVAQALGCRADEVIFTDSGTTAVHRGVAGLLVGRRRVGQHVVTSAIEHSSVLNALADGHRRGTVSSTTAVGVDVFGRVDVDAFAAALRPDTAFAALQSANHEVGTTQPVDAVWAGCQSADVPLLVDGAQSVGRAPIPPGWSVLTASAHKWGGPAGVGILAVRSGARWRAPTPPDERQGGRSPGFENVPGIVAAAAALEAVTQQSAADDVRLRALTDRIRSRVPQLVPDVQVLGDPSERLPHLVTFSCLYVEGEALLGELDRAGFAVSSGSSCTSSTLEPSHVLVAMGALSHGNIRVSMPRTVTEAEVDRFLAVLPGAVQRVRDSLGAAGL